MMEAILCGGKSTKTAMRQRMNPNVIITSLPKIDRVCENFKRSLSKIRGILQLDQKLFDENKPGMIAKIHVLREIHFSVLFLRLRSFGFYSEFSEKTFFFFADFQAKPGLNSIKLNTSVVFSESSF